MRRNEEKVIRGGAAAITGARAVVTMALLAALSIVFGKLLAFNVTQALRISFENLPLLLASILLGPVQGLIVGAVADIVGCFLVGYALNPVITLGAMSIGALSGLVFRALRKQSLTLRLAASVAVPHVVGSMLIKSIGLYLYLHLAVPLLLMRIPTYIVIAAAEFCIIRLLMTNKGFIRQIEGLLH